MYALRYREELPPAVVKEMDDFISFIQHFLGVSLNEDGSIKFLPTPAGNVDPGGDSTTLIKNVFETGGSSSSDNHIAVYNSVTGSLKDSGFTIEDISPIKFSPVVRWNNADIEAGTAHQFAAGVANKIIVPMYLEIHSDFTSPVGGYLTSRAMQVRYATGATGVDLLDGTNTAFHNTAIVQRQRIASTPEMVFATNNPVGVAVNGQPGGTNTFLGVPPSNYFLDAQLAYVLVPAI